MPVVHPAEIWKQSGRYFKIGPELVRFKDRADREMVLAMTHEEVVALLLSDIVRSYRQLPMIVYHFQTKFRDEPRSRGGLIRVREFVMKDSYSCDRDWDGLDRSYRLHYGAYQRIFERLGLDAIVVGADVGIMGGTEADEFMVLNDSARTRLVLCDNCDYAANRQIATVGKPRPGPGALAADGGRRDTRRDDDRGARSLPRHPGEPDGQGGVLRHRRRPVRGGDRARRLRRRGDQARQRGQGDRRPPARASSRRSRPAAWRPVTARRSGRAMRSSSSTSSSSARRTSSPARTGSVWHVRNVNVPRDFDARRRRRDRERAGGRSMPPLRLAAQAPQRDRGRQHLQARDGLRRSRSGPTTSGEDGKEHPVVMGSYGIGLGRNVACIVEAHHDEKGIVWPAEVGALPGPPRVDRSEQGATGRGDRPRPPRRRHRPPVASCCGTTGTSRPGSSSPTPSCSGCPGSSRSARARWRRAAPRSPSERPASGRSGRWPTSRRG